MVEHLIQGLEAIGVQVKQQLLMDTDHYQISPQAQAVVVNLEPGAVWHEQFLERLLEQKQIPVLFNEAVDTIRLSNGDHARWLRHLRAKIEGWHNPNPLPQATMIQNSLSRQREAKQEMAIWVLAASIGGPEALRSFFTRLPPDLPVAFILAQHMGAEFQPLLTNQLNAISDCTVYQAETGRALLPGDVVVVPVDKMAIYDQDLKCQLEPITGEQCYSPCIDNLLEGLVANLGSKINLIVFSGMASDGIRGSQKVSEAGGAVWTQSPDSCVVSSMVEGATAVSEVGFEGEPEDLAQTLADLYPKTGKTTGQDSCS